MHYAHLRMELPGRVLARLEARSRCNFRGREKIRPGRPAPGVASSNTRRTC